MVLSTTCFVYYLLHLACFTYCPCYTSLFHLTLIHLATCYIITMYYLLQYLLHLVVDDEPDNSSAASLHSTKVFKCLMDNNCIDRHVWMKILLSSVFPFREYIFFFLSFFRCFLSFKFALDLILLGQCKCSLLLEKSSKASKGCSRHCINNG